MTNDLPIRHAVPERADTDRRTITYPADLTGHLCAMHWSRASNVYAQHRRLFCQEAEADYSERGMRLREKLASLN